MIYIVNIQINNLLISINITADIRDIINNSFVNFTWRRMKPMGA